MNKLTLGAAITVICLSTLGFSAEGSGSLKVKADPGRAGIFVDGKYVGPSANFKIARTYSLPAGEHEIRIVDPRCEEVVKKVTIESGKKVVLTEALKPLTPAKPPFGLLRVQHPDHFAAVYINSRFMGHVDEFNNHSQGLKLNPGTYELKVVPVTTGSPITKTVTIETDKTVVVKEK